MEALQSLTTGDPIHRALDQARQRLTIAGCGAPRLDAELLLAYSLKQDRVWLLSHPNTPLNQPEAEVYDRLIARRVQHEPLAYIIGQKPFYGLDFAVNPHVLIPRPETELLVEIALGLINRANLTIVDIGTGSGCIAVSIAYSLVQRHLPSALLAVDVSADVLAVARKNAARYGLAQNITFVQSNLLSAITGPIDVLVSNPPYVKDMDLQSSILMPDVALYEPRLALDGGPDGLGVIRQLLAQAKAKLAPSGAALLEIGFEQGPAVHHLARSHFPDATITICQDLAGLDRVVLIQR